MSMTLEQIGELNTSQILDKIVEEAAETIQAALKMKHYGATAVGNTGIKYDNLAALTQENNQVAVACMALCIKYDRSYMETLKAPTQS